MDVFSVQLKEWVKADRPKQFKNYNLIKAQNRKQSLEQSPSFVSKQKVKKVLSPQQQIRMDLMDFSTSKGDENGKFTIVDTWTEHTSHPKLEFDERKQLFTKIQSEKHRLKQQALMEFDPSKDKSIMMDEAT